MATLGYSGVTLASVLWKSSVLWKGYFGLLKNWLLRDHSGECAVEGLFGLLRGHFGQRGVEELLWATQGSLWPVEELSWAGSLWGACCGRATLGYSGITLANVLWKG